MELFKLMADHPFFTLMLVFLVFEGIEGCIVRWKN
jgi:hypothetical protein